MWSWQVCSFSDHTQCTRETGSLRILTKVSSSSRALGALFPPLPLPHPCLFRGYDGVWSGLSLPHYKCHTSWVMFHFLLDLFPVVSINSGHVWNFGHSHTPFFIKTIAHAKNITLWGWEDLIKWSLGQRCNISKSSLLLEAQETLNCLSIEIFSCSFFWDQVWCKTNGGHSLSICKMNEWAANKGWTALMGTGVVWTTERVQHHSRVGDESWLWFASISP